MNRDDWGAIIVIIAIIFISTVLASYAIASWYNETHAITVPFIKPAKLALSVIIH